MIGNRDVKYLAALDALNQGASTVNGLAIDTAGYEIVDYTVLYGISATGTSIVKVQDTVDDPAAPGTPLAGGWADVAAGALPSVAPTAATKRVISVSTRKTKRWQRLVNTVATAAVPNGASAALRIGHASHPEPVADLVIGFA